MLGLMQRKMKVTSWNQKFLDYEIETKCMKTHNINATDYVGIKSFSITRLKPVCMPVWSGTSAALVGIKSFSITRLKLSKVHLMHEHGCLRVGIKSFSITRLKLGVIPSCEFAKIHCWNQKFLDYEIETKLSLWDAESHHRTLESKVSRLRDWNSCARFHLPLLYCGQLESKVSRLRDWNLMSFRSVSVRNTRKLESKVSRLRDWNKVKRYYKK